LRELESVLLSESEWASASKPELALELVSPWESVWRLAWVSESDSAQRHFERHSVAQSQRRDLYHRCRPCCTGWTTKARSYHSRSQQSRPAKPVTDRNCPPGSRLTKQRPSNSW